LTALLATAQGVRAAQASKPDEVGAASVAFLELMALVLYAWMWLRMMVVASKALQSGHPDSAFYQAKLDVGHFFLKRQLPRYKSLVEEIQAGSAVLMAMDASAF